MEERLAELEAQSVTHYQSAQFEKAEAAYTALLTDTDSNTEPGLLARIFNNRGHARYRLQGVLVSRPTLDKLSIQTFI